MTYVSIYGRGFDAVSHKMAAFSWLRAIFG